MLPSVSTSIRRLLAFAVFALFLAGASPSQARLHRLPRKPKAQVPYTAIESVDVTRMTITTQPMNSTASGVKTYRLTPRTKVTVNGQPATLSDLKPGLQVRVGAGMDADVAEEIAATPPPPKVK